VAPEIRRVAAERRLRAIDATCPLVTKVHLEAIKYASQGYRIVLIGHEGHDEVIGTIGQAPAAFTLVESPEDVDTLPFGTDDKLAYLTQTTLSVDDASRIISRLRERFPQIVGPPKDDICYATQNRQEAVRLLSEDADLVIVLDIDLETASRRLARPLDRLESRGDAYRQRLRDGYHAEAARDPARIRLVDASAEMATVADRIRMIVESRFPELK
jgi:4-hydroxy-3-methylbut-2-enyl diphosphate reductase